MVTTPRPRIRWRTTATPFQMGPHKVELSWRWGMTAALESKLVELSWGLAGAAILESARAMAESAFEHEYERLLAMHPVEIHPLSLARLSKSRFARYLVYDRAAFSDKLRIDLIGVIVSRTPRASKVLRGQLVGIVALPDERDSLFIHHFLVLPPKVA